MSPSIGPRNLKTPHDIRSMNYKERFAFLKVPDRNDLSVDEDEQRYLLAYNLYLYITRSLIFVSIGFILNIIMITSSQMVKTATHGFVKNDILMDLWPWNGIYLRQFSESSLAYQRAFHSEDEIYLFITGVGVTSAVWLVWVSYRILVEIRRRDYYEVNIRIIFVFFITFISFWAAASGMATEPSDRPSVFGSIYTSMIEKEVFISIFYWNLGLSMCFISTILRRLYFGMEILR